MPENDSAMNATCWVHLGDEAPTGCWSNRHFGACVLGQANGWRTAELQMCDNLSAVVEIELDRLRSMPIVELRALWHAKFKTDPPKAFGPDLLRRSLAYKIQENAYGGIDSTTARLLKQLMAQHAKTLGKIVLPRRLKPGVVLVREWKGQRHRVTVTQDGFAYDGKEYNSLSKIARLITGSRWNGPRFFGLRSDNE
jgi:hypothetical protein